MNLLKASSASLLAELAWQAPNCSLLRLLQLQEQHRQQSQAEGLENLLLLLWWCLMIKAGHQVAAQQ